MPELAEKIMQIISNKEKINIDERRQVESQINEVERKIGNIIKAIEDGSVDFELWGDRLKSLKARREELECPAEPLNFTITRAYQGNGIALFIRHQKLAD